MNARAFLFSLAFGVNVLNAGIHEPDFQLYGKLIDTGSAHPIEVDDGTLSWNLNRQGQTLTFDTDVRLFGESTTFSYVVTIPADTGIDAFLSATEIDLGSGEERLSTLVVTLEYDGATYPVTLNRNASDSLKLSQETRGRSMRVDLEVYLPILDSDGDGMPDAYEDQFDELDKLVPDGSLDPDNDLFTNLDEYLANTNPVIASTAPSILSENLNATFGGVALLRVDVADLDDNPAIDPLNPSFVAASGLVYTLDSLSDGFALLRSTSGFPGTGAFAAYEVLSPGATFTHAELLQGRVLIRHDAQSLDDGSLGLSLTDSVNTPVSATLPISLWDPSGPEGDSLQAWIHPLAGQFDVFGNTVAAGGSDGSSLDFSGSNSYQQAPAGWMGDDNWQMFAVLDRSGSGQQGILTTPHGSLSLMADDDQQFPGHVRLDLPGGSVISEYAVGPAIFIDASLQGNALALSANGASPVRGFSVDDIPVLPANDRLGVDASGNHFEGGLHELMVFPDTLNARALADVSTYLQTRWNGRVVIDALQSMLPYVGATPSSLLSVADYEALFVPAFGEALPYTVLAWNRNVTFFGGYGDDAFWIGGGSAWIQGGGGADHFIITQGGPEQVIADFLEGEGDVLDLQYLFSGVVSDQIDQYVTIEPEGLDALVSVYPQGDPSAVAETTIRLLNRADLNQSRLSALYAMNALDAGGVRPALTIGVESGDPEAIEVDEKSAEVEFTFAGGDLPAGKELVLDMDTDMTLGQDFKLLAEVYDADADDYLTVELTNYRVPVELKPGDDRLRVRVQPIANKVTQADRSIDVSLMHQTGVYSISSSAASTTVSLIDGLPYLIIEPTSDEVDPSVSGEGFRVTRMGATDVPLTFDVSLEGTAINGTDYQYISSEQMIPAGAEEILLPVNALRYALSENANVVALRLSPQDHYQLQLPAVALITLRTEVIVVNLDVIQSKAVLSDSQPQARFFLQLSGPPASGITMIPLEFNGSTQLSEYEIVAVSPSGTETPVSIDPVSRSGNIFLLPGETFCLIKMLPRASVALDEGGKSVEIELSSPPAGAEYQPGERNSISLYIVGDFAAWAAAHNGGMEVQNLQDWALEKHHPGGLENLVAYSLGLTPEDADARDGAVRIFSLGGGQFEVWVPYYEGVTGVDVFLEQSGGLGDEDWQTMDTLVLDRVEVQADRQYQVFRGTIPANDRLFIRKVATLVD